MAKNLALAMEIQRKNKSKKSPTAATESRPSTQTESHDAISIAHDGARKALIDAGMMQAPEGDMKRPKLESKKSPNMVKSDAFSTRLRTSEDDMIDTMPPKKYADGGPVENDTDEDQADDADTQPSPAMAKAISGVKTKVEPKVEHMEDSMYADGGEVSPDDEEMMEHHASIAAAIMAKKAAQMSLDSGSEDEDDAEMYAEGGSVDIDDNEEEQSNQLDSRNKAALKENYDEDMDDVSQPDDSNEDGDSEEDDSENKNDRISAMRKRMMAKRR